MTYNVFGRTLNLAQSITVSPVAAVIIKSRNTFTAYSTPDFRNRPQAGKVEDEGDDSHRYVKM